MGKTTHPKERGQQTEAAIICEFVQNGLTVLEPFGDNERYDVVVEEAGKFYRVQIKTGRLENGCVQFETRSSGTLTREVKKEGYEGEVEVFAVYAPEIGRSFVVPIAEAPKTTMGIRVEESEKSSPNINWAEDYSLKGWAESIRSATR
ncbi:group I intron-associated PD-(D/E)XK endonuclease [Halorussus gelatinilyticus]|uniref:Group I intron-associated PD-(D/E)XK endonuclease n=1 Tax=Halorussus gelatinilyticus TaxID=2937524 RepID=A0A8U0INQ7_9EURY|nr:group I intron-associated PD-(D/E)XK endonuclease [Halorussus gelatinilyticus]UPW02186.1 group I intron-associated PD-(D/E)XK endonuclease [Halorussus gelatinilyticus]